MKIKSGFMNDVIISSCGQLLVMVIMFGINKLLSMRLNPAEYAIYGIANKSAQVVSFFVLFCLGIAIPRYLPRYLKNGDVDKGMAFIKAGVLCTVILAFFVIVVGTYWQSELSRLIFSEMGREMLFRGMLFFAAGLAVCSILYAFFRGIDDFFRFSLSQIVFQLLLFMLSVVLFSDLAAMMICWGIILLFGGTVWLWHSCRNFFDSEMRWRVWGKTERACLREIVVFCLPRVPGELILFSFQTVPLIILNGKIGAEETAGYVVALMLNSMLTPFFGMVGMVLLPYVSKRTGSKDEQVEVKNRIGQLMELYCIISVMLTIGIFLFCDYLLLLVFDAKYLVYRDLVKYMSLSILPNAVYLLLRNPLDAVSVKPLNTINLFISFAVMVGMLFWADTWVTYAAAFVAGYLLLGLLSWISWEYCPLQKRIQI